MSSDGSWHLLYYSLSDSTSLSCCTQPRSFNSRWLIQEITFSLPPHSTIPVFQSSDAVSVCSAVPHPSTRGYWQPGAHLPVRACWWLAQGSSKELRAPLQTCKGHDICHLAETCPKPSRLLCYGAPGISITPHWDRCTVPNWAPAFSNCTWLCSGGVSLPP